MNIEQIQAICKTFKATTEDVKWGHDLCYCVGAKIYCVVALSEPPTTASFKVPGESFE
ncbi:MAG TPA: MmcQ/YjbR family DNA-binding protein [Chitinophagales bacterium]|nr:MmcQ/YjbR family DNA-binding protein [Chitinophagales bacterium]